MKKTLLSITLFVFITLLSFAQNAAPSVESILNRCIQETFKKLPLDQIKDCEIVNVGNAMGREMMFTNRYLLPNGFMQKIGSGEQIFMYQSKINDTYNMVQQNNQVPIDDNIKKLIDANSYIIPELGFIKKLDKIKYIGADKVDGVDAYELSVSDESGENNVHLFYSVSLGLRIKMTTETKQGNVDISYLDYKEYPCGLVFYSKMSIIYNSQFTIENDVKSIKVNSGLKPSDLEK
ncbi:MAG: hypothetical protein QM539_08615 [Alphaproteobacteria bacterium]|nr:hypothetical protein [Alphaproteobacteria bacterium]